MLERPDAFTFVSTNATQSSTIGLVRHGAADPCTHKRPGLFWRATRTSSGPATARYETRSDGFDVSAWGPGAQWVIENAAAALGSLDDFSSFDPSAHPLVKSMHHQNPGLRFPRTYAVWEATLPAILEQKVVAQEALTSWKQIVRAFGEPAPSAGDDGPTLWCPPAPDSISHQGYPQFHRLGVERKRADTIKFAALRSVRLEESAGLESRARLEAFPGIGPWTSALVASVAWGDADAPLVGDYHVAQNVVFAMTGLQGGTDDDMLELLEPFAPHRGRAARLVLAAGIGVPSRAPKARLRDIRNH